MAGGVSRETRLPKLIHAALTIFVNHLLTDAEIAENHVENILHVHPAGQAP